MRRTPAHASPVQVVVCALREGESSGSRTSTNGPTQGEAKMGMDYYFLASERPSARKGSLELFGLSVRRSLLVTRMRRQWRSGQSSTQAGLG